MKFMSFVRFFGKRWLRGKPRRDRITPRPARAQLTLEALEHRVMLSAAPPRIVSVTPPDNSTVTVLSPQPTISVTFSEAMVGTNGTPGTGAANPLNYLLVDASGDTIAISSATLNAADTVVTLGYNGGNPLPANTYTLFVRGNNLVDQADGQPLAQLAQAFVANDGQNDVAVVNLDTDGTLGASSNYPLPTTGVPPAAAPYAVSHADLNGDGLPDLIIADVATEQLLIFAGRPLSKGGGFNLNPDLTLKLPTAVAADVAIGGIGKSIVVDDFTDFKPNGLPSADVLPDIAVANADSNTVSVFLNNRSLNSIGTLSFTLSTTVDLSPLVAAGKINGTPTGIVAGDIDNDGYQDIVVVNGDAPKATVPGTPYFATVLLNFSVSQNGTSTTGHFGIATADCVPMQIGISANPNAKPAFPNEGLLEPTSIALGDLNGDGKPDVAVGGSNGIALLFNTSSPGSVTFGPLPEAWPLGLGAVSEPVVALPEGTTSLAIGAFHTKGTPGPAGPFSKGFNDVVASLFGTAPGPEIADLANSGGGFSTTISAFPAMGPLAITNPGLGQIALADLNGDGFNDVVLTNDFQSPPATNSSTPPIPSGLFGEVYALHNVDGSATDLVQFPSSPYSTGSTPIGVDVLDYSNDGIPGIAPVKTPNPLPPVELITANNLASNFTLFLSNGDGTFRVPTVVPVSTNIETPLTAIAVGDLNGDGIPDMVVVNDTGTSQQTQVLVLLGLGGGKFSSPVPLSSSSNTPPYYDVTNAFNDVVSVAIGDLSNDGLPDIILASRAQSKVEVLTNNLTKGSTTLTAGSFTATAPVPVGTAPTELITGDFNNDGNLDVAVSHDSGGGPNSNRGVSMLIGKGDGTFQPSYEVIPAEGAHATAVVSADFNRDGNLDLVVTDAVAAGTVRLLYGDGSGNFRLGGSFVTGLDLAPSISSAAQAALAVADVNNDGYPDLAVSSPSASATQGGIAVLINQLGTGFGPPIETNLLPGTPIESLAFNDVNQDGLGDLIVTTAPVTGSFTADNAFLLVGNGDGTFGSPVPYLAGANGTPTPIPSFMVVTPSPLLRVTTFVQGGNLIEGNLVSNGGFEKSDLSNETGNVDGWTTYRELNPNTGSHGQWDTQIGLASPLSGVAVPAPPQGNYQAMLDQADLVPIPPVPAGAAAPTNPNSNADYAGTNVLYQNITVPSSTTILDLSFSLYLDSSSVFSDAALNPSLDYQTTAANQQVRVDLMSPNSPILGYTSGSDPFFGGVLFNAYISHATDSPTGIVTVHITTDPTQPQFYNQNLAALLSQIVGTTVRLRIAAANNQGKLIVGVDNVRVNATYTDTSTPFFTTADTIGAHLRNVSYISNGIPYTTDPTIVGQVGDVGSVNNIAYVEFDPNNTNFSGPAVYKILTVDPNGNFTFTLPSLTPGVYNLRFAIVSRASDPASGIPFADFQTLTFGLQGASVTQFEATGPAGINVAGQKGVDYTSVSGRVTAVATDPSDSSGNTYYVGSANGGVWKTTDGGSSWMPLTDYITDAKGNPVQPAIGALAVAPTNSQVIYAGTGVADLQADSRIGVGILKSTNGGLTWTLLGNATNPGAINLIGARISSIVVDNNSPQVVYVAVASGGSSGPGVYKSTDGGVTWVDVLVTKAMFLAPPAANGTPVPAGTALASVTDLIIDPFDANHLLVGLGNMGLLPASITAGLWSSVNGGGTWFQELGGDNGVINSNLPSGVTVGRVTVAISTVRVANEAVVYVLIANPPVTANNVPPNVDQGQVNQIAPSGLYKSSNNLLDFTRVDLKQNVGTAAAPKFVDIGLGVEGSNAYGLAVEPTDPNVVYVGGSLDFDSFAVNPGITPASLVPTVQHALIRVDTGDMRDASYVDTSTKVIANDGDDQVKALTAEAAGGKYPSGAAYSAEGVYWYDVVEGASGANGGLQLLPPDIHALSFDAQGRLLIGTNGGIWRGEDRGFSYDFGSGGTGIVVPSDAFATPGMSLTAINGNLQITELTSVAIDPVTAGTLYTTQFGTGSALSTSTLSWISSNPTGPTIVSGATSTNLGIPNGEVVLAAPTPTNVPPATPTTLYRLWQYADSKGVVPEKSIDGGLTWAVVNNGIPISNNPAAGFPALAIAPTLTLDGGQQFDQLLLGTQQVFVTRTNGNAWTQISSTLTSSPGDFITALAFGPPPQPLAPVNVFYAGTTMGEVFVTMNGGTDNWPMKSSGLPVGDVTQIVVDPTDPTGKTAYLTFGAGPNNTLFNHVYFTVNGGSSWQSVSPLASGLPEVNVNGIAIDRTPALGAPKGKIYVATDVGVYVTLNNGASWVRVGSSLPNAPVVALQLSQSQHVLAAAAQGRGVFTISTAQISPIADQILNTNSSTGPIAFTINTIGVANPNSFSVSVTSSNQAIIPNASLVLSGSGAARTLDIIPAFNTNTFTSGPVTVTVIVTDLSNGDTFSEPFLVNVLGNLVVNENGSRSFIIGVDDATIVTGSSSNQAIIPSNGIVVGSDGSGERVVTITPAPNQAGPLNVTLTYTDVNGITQSTTTFAVLVQNTAVVLPFADNFNRPDNTFLGSAWSVLTGNIALKSDAGQVLSAGAPNGAAVAVLNGTVRADVSLSTDVTLAVGQSAGLVARQSGAGDTNMYAAQLTETASGFFAQILRIESGSVVVLASTDVTGFAGVGLTTTIRFDVIGTSLKMYVGTGANLALAAYATDVALSAGALGLRGSSGVVFDNFVANNVAVASPSLPFTDTFATGGLVNQLSSKWEDRAGNFAVVGGAAQGGPLTGSTTANVSILRGANDADVVVTANVNVAVGGNAGLVARYSGSGDDTMYLGVLDNSTGTPMAEIMRSTGPGTWLVLNQAAAPSNSGTLRFVVIGDALQLFLGNTLMTFATDTTLTEGSVGIRGSATAFTDFTATAVPAIQTPLPFSDDFVSTADAYGQPQANWLIRRGDIQITGGAALGQDPQASDHSPNNPSHINLAVLAGLNVADVNASLAIAVNAGDQAGLVVRYQDDNNYYLGVLDNTGSSPVAAIWRVAGGVATQLAAAAPPDIQGTLQFTVVGSSLQLSLSGNLVVSTTDTALTTGAVGVLASATQVGAFSVSAATSTLPFSDNFSGTTLGPAWTVDAGAFALSGGMATGQNAGSNLATLPGVNSADVDLSVEVNLNTGNSAGLIARYSGPGESNLYLGLLNDTSGTPMAQIYLNLGGKYTLLGQAVASASGGTLQFQVVGSSLRLFLNGTPQVAVRDTTLATGAVGLRGSANTSFANFNAVVAPAVLPFVDSFSTSGTLSDSWLTEAGTFAVGGATANGQNPGNVTNPINLATLPSVNAADVVVSASVNVASGQQAGLIARHSALGDANYYLGEIDSTSGSPIAKIILNVGGIATTLASAPIPANHGTLQFEVDGSSLRLFLSNTLLVAANDTTLASGSVGMRASVTSLGNFTASLDVPATAPVPFSDNFAAGNAQGQLASTWTTRAGDFAVAGGLATAGSGTTNLAVLGGVSVANVTVSAAIALTVQQAALVANYNGNAMYLGVIDNTSAIPLAQIYRISATGQKTLLGQAASPSGTGTLTFQVAGSALRLSLNGALLVDATDPTPLAAGSVGISGSANVTFGNFTASQSTPVAKVQPTITSTEQTTFTENTPNSFTITTIGAPAPALTETGTLPAGVTFQDNHDGTATLSGTPTTTGTYNFTVTASNGIGAAYTQNFTLTVALPLTVATPTLTPNTAVAVASNTFSISGTFSDPNLPLLTPFLAIVNWGDGTHSEASVSGSVNPFNYVFGGTHAYTQPGTYNVTITVTDADGATGTSSPVAVTVNPLAGAFAYDPSSQTLTITGTNFTFAQATTADAGGLHTIYSFTVDGTLEQFADTVIAHTIVNGQGTAATAILITNNTYVAVNGTTQETRESISLGSKADDGVGSMQKFDANGNPFTFLTLTGFPTSYAYVGRADGTVTLYGTAGLPYNGFVSAGNYSYIGGPGEFHLAQGATSVYGYGAGQPTDFAYHYSANAGSAFVISGIAFSYMSTTDTVNGVTLPYFNVGVGFTVNTGVSKHPGQDFAYIIDSPANDTFVGGDAYSYMYSTNSAGNFTEFDTAYAFAMVFGESFVGGTDDATNANPNKNILAGFHLV